LPDKYYSFEPNDIAMPEVHKFMLGGISPRPIAFVSTRSKDGIDNLAPYSFFNAFGANPPYLAFSPARRGRDDTTKDTYHNLLDTKECVVHIVSHGIVHQMNLASCEYPADTDEFVKAGFTKLESDLVSPPRVRESSFHMECVLDQMIELGGRAGSGNLALCRVIKFHVSESIIVDGSLSPELLDAVGRNGGNYYTRASGDALFQIDKPNRDNGIGFDNLPQELLDSHILSGNDLGRLAMISEIPTLQKAREIIRNYITDDVIGLAEYIAEENEVLTDREMFTHLVKKAIHHNDIDLAWAITVIQGEE